MGKPYKSVKKRYVEPSKRDHDVTLAGKYFLGVVKADSNWNVEKIKHLYDIVQIPIDKLYATKNKISVKSVYSEADQHIKMTDYEPINVIKRDKRYIVISGHERVVALMARGFKKIKARIYDLDK